MSLVLLFPKAQSSVITGTGALTTPAVTVSGTGVLEHTGTGALTIPAVTASGTGVIEHTGTGALTTPATTVSGTGTVNTEVTGTGALTIPVTEVSGTGVVNTEITGTGALTLPAVEISGTNIIPEVGGGIGHRRKRHRQFCNIDGKLIEVSSYSEAVNLFKSLKKQDVKPKKRRIKLKFQDKYVSVFDSPTKPSKLKDIKQQLQIMEEEDDLLLLLLAL